MGGSNESKVVSAPSSADEISSGMIKNKSFSFWKFFKNRRNKNRAAPALPEDQPIIVARPKTRSGGIAYEYFVHEKFGFLKKPPARLQKLMEAKKLREARGDAKLREEIENRMNLAEERRRNVIDKVRRQQTRHLVVDIGRARYNLAALKEEKIQMTAERLHQKEMMSQIVQDRAIIHRGFRKMQRKQRRADVRLCAALKNLALREEEVDQARKVIVASPMRGVEPDQIEEEELGEECIEL
ncbi:uncharacterized protein LOC119722072 [Patiria miniata]|uniref:Uncharacterized protein n=1 Tax=Patiria miniata TaxID=46514 RepID=A0A913ZAG9_PATMI|nr:uncharacterized protein LOC119722072 [Patiria miniata]